MSEMRIYDVSEIKRHVQRAFEKALLEKQGEERNLCIPEAFNALLDFRNRLMEAFGYDEF